MPSPSGGPDPEPLATAPETAPRADAIASAAPERLPFGPEGDGDGVLAPGLSASGAPARPGLSREQVSQVQVRLDRVMNLARGLEP